MFLQRQWQRQSLLVKVYISQVATNNNNISLGGIVSELCVTVYLTRTYILRMNSYEFICIHVYS
jgi:hypothetical protein